MTSHLFKLIYNQRRSNGWIVLELFLIFILIWVLVDFFSVLYLTARTPVGADITDTYLVKLIHINQQKTIQIQLRIPFPAKVNAIRIVRLQTRR